MFSTQLSGQFDFKKGFLITTKGDTINGFIKDQTFDKLSKQVTFKTSRKANADTYLPLELKGFGFNDGDRFESFEIAYSSSSRKGKTQDVDIVRFLHKIAGGKIALFELTEAEKPLFIKKENGPLQLLCFNKTLSNKTVDEENYIQILRFEMSDCEKIVVDDKLPLKRKAILELIKRYNKHCRPLVYQKDWKGQRNTIVGRFSVFSSTPLSYFSEFGGLGGGLMMELGDRHITANFGAEYIIGRKKPQEDNEFNYKLLIATLRANYRPFLNKKLSPYAFAGLSINAGARKANIQNFQKKKFADFELGLGLDYKISKQFFIKGEVAYPHFPHVRLGIGMLIK